MQAMSRGSDRPMAPAIKKPPCGGCRTHLCRYSTLVVGSQRHRLRPLGTGETLGPVTVVQAGDFHRLAGARRMDETSAGNVDAHMRDAVTAMGAEEHQVARLDVGAIDLDPGQELAGGGARQLQA